MGEMKRDPKVLGAPSAERLMRRTFATHPGEHLAEYLEVRGWRQADLSRATGLTKKTISLIISGQNPITANTALKLADVFPLKAEIWMALQANYDLHRAKSA